MPFFEHDHDTTDDDNLPAGNDDVIDVREAIADIALASSLPVKVRNRIASGVAGAFVIKVPTSQWARPMVDAIEEMATDGSWVFLQTEVPKSSTTETVVQRVSFVAKRLSAGKMVVGVSHDPKRCLPSNLLAAADTHEISAFDGQLLMKLLRRCAVGTVPKSAVSLRVDILDFEELAALIPAGGRAGDIVRAIEEAISRRIGAVNDDGSLPDLVDCVEFGEAREWALDLAQDIRDMRDGRIGWDECDRGVILFGPSGTGKTMLARLLGKACGIPTIVASVADLFASSSGYLDGVIKAQRALFERAKSQAPCILFLDECNAMPNVDTLGSRNRDYWTPVILDFYTLLDSAVSQRDGVIVVGATNRIEDINPAILRPGRLERAIFVGPPDAVGVDRILRQHLEGELRDADFTNLAMAAEAQQLTGAVLMKAVRAARRRARRESRDMTLVDLETAVLPPTKVDPEHLKRMAFHEAGHVLIGAALAADRLVRADLFAGMDGGTAYGGRVRFKEWPPLMTAESIEKEVSILLAGRAAEEVIYGAASSGAGGHEGSDLAAATQLLAQRHASWGLGNSLVWRGEPEDLATLMRIDAALNRAIDNDLKRIAAAVRVDLESRQHELHALADELFAKRGLTAEEIFRILGSNGPGS